MGKKRDAIREDVSKEEPTETEQEETSEETKETEPTRKKEAPIDPNLALRNQIAADREKEIAEEVGISVEEGDSEETEKTSEDSTPELEEESESNLEEDMESEDGSEEEGLETSEKTPAEVQKEKLIVDGQETEVEVSKIFDAGRRAIQKDLAADKRLEEATRLQKEAMDLLQQAKEQAGQKKESAQEQEAPPEEDVPREKLVEAVEAIQIGDTDEGVEALEQILKGLRRSAPDTPVPDVREVVQRELYQREQMRIRDRFFQPPEKGGFSDLVPPEHGGTGDVATFAAVNALVQHLVTVEKKPDTWATYEQAGLAIRNRFNPKPAHEEKEQGDPTQKKEDVKKKKVERKRSLASVKSVTASIETPDIEEDEKPSDIINEMRKARGLAV